MPYDVPEQTSREKRLARYFRYNRSAKGQLRNRRYEDKHPERKERWGALAMTRNRPV